jgi:hypothetical protein
MEHFLCRTGWSLAHADEAACPSAPADLDDDRGLRLTLAEEEVSSRR